MEEGRLADKSTQDGVATLTAITAAAVAHATKVLPRAPAGWLVAGGGTRNPTLMRMLAQRLAPVGIETAGAVGWSADALEAQAFAYLAVRALKGLPLTFPTTTGVPRPLTGGVLVRKPERRPRVRPERSGRDGLTCRTRSRMTRSMPLTTRARFSPSTLSGVSLGRW